MTSPAAAAILIVDDEIQNRKLLDVTLRPEGYVTRFADCGRAALASISECAPDLILLDVMMPDMDGYEVAAALKADPATSNIPIIMVTALIDRKARLAGLDAGVEEFLTKPVDRAELWLRVRNLLRMKDLADALQAHGALLEQKVQARTTELLRLNRLYAMLGGINALIVRARDQRELFTQACRIAVEEGTFRAAWIGTIDSKTLDGSVVAWFGCEEGDVEKVRITARDGTPDSQHPASRALRESRPVICNDIATDSSAAPLTEDFLRSGHRSLACFPLLVAGRSEAVIALFAGDPTVFDDEETRLLLQVARDVSFAIGNITKQQQLDKLSRVRTVSSEINAAIVRIRERKTLLQEVCRIVCVYGKFEMIWIGAIDHATQQIEPVAWAGFSEETAHAVDWSGVAATDGTIGKTIRSGKASVRNDLAPGDMARGKLRQEALARGYRSSLCLPLIVDGSASAVIVLFAPGQGFFDKDELGLLNESASDISFALQAIEKQERLDYIAYYDGLTGLANRSLFLERLTQCTLNAVSGAHKLAVYLLDVERFKNINDTLGQSAGDALLQQVAVWLSGHGGDPSQLARLGADQFAVVLPEIRHVEDVARRLETMLAVFMDHPFQLKDGVFRVAAKIGVALFPDDGENAETLVKHAEAALKKAKASGARYLFYTQKMTEAVAAKLTLENQLRQALDKNEFVLHYQPKMDLATGLITSGEALIRWNDPRTGLVPPGRFIPVLEETGMIYEVGRWAMRKAVEDYGRWRTAGLGAVRIAVNVSPLQLRNPGFIAEVEHAIGSAAGAAAGLELEITESLIMEDIRHSITVLQTIRGMGITVAIDDFGTGFSSLSYLSKLPVDTLKIDRSFVIDMTTGPEGLSLVSTIINLAHSLKLKVVAEGVETQEQSKLLELLGCDEMQGFLFSKPVPVEIFEARHLVPLSDMNLQGRGVRAPRSVRELRG